MKWKKIIQLSLLASLPFTSWAQQSKEDKAAALREIIKKSGADPSTIISTFKIPGAYYHKFAEGSSPAQQIFISKLEYTAAFGKSWGLSFRIPLSYSSIPSLNVSDFGVGDIAIFPRYSFKASPKLSISAGIEFTLPTATYPSLGPAQWQISPGMAFVVFPLPQIFIPVVIKHSAGLNKGRAEALINRTMLRLLFGYAFSTGTIIVLDSQNTWDWAKKGYDGAFEFQIVQIAHPNVSLSFILGAGYGPARSYDFSGSFGINVAIGGKAGAALSL